MQSSALRVVFIRLLVLFNALVWAIYLGCPIFRSQFVDENMFLENAGAIFFFLAFLLGAAVWTTLPPGTMARKIGWLIPLLGLLGFLDDTSYFGILEGEEAPGRPTTIVGMSRLPAGRHVLHIGPYRVDALHDFFSISMKAVRDTGSIAVYVVVVGIISAAAALAFVYRQRYMPAIMAFCRRYPAFDYLRLAFIFIAISLVLDLHIIGGDSGHFLPELFEVNGAICLAFGAAALPLAEGD